MGKLTLEILENTFNSKNTGDYTLSILLGMDSLVYTICDHQQAVLVLNSYSLGKEVNHPSKLESALAEVLNSDNLLNLPYREVRVAIQNNSSTLVPDELYDDKQKAAYLVRMAPHSDHDLIKVDDLRNLQLKNVYLVPKGIINRIRDHFTNVKFYHSFTPVLQQYKKIAGSRIGQTIFANVRQQQVQICYFDGKELVFNNSFPFLSSKDFIYFVLNVFHQFNLKPEAIPVILSGQIVEDSEIYKLLYRYIRHIQLINLPDDNRLGEQFDSVPHHFYFDLLTLTVCE